MGMGRGGVGRWPGCPLDTPECTINEFSTHVGCASILILAQRMFGKLIKLEIMVSFHCTTLHLYLASTIAVFASQIRMYSSRMHTVRCSGHPEGGLPKGCLPRRGCLHREGGVCPGRGCLPMGGLPRRVYTSPGEQNHRQV